jgi:hypothetical protein
VDFFLLQRIRSKIKRQIINKLSHSSDSKKAIESMAFAENLALMSWSEHVNYYNEDGTLSARGNNAAQCYTWGEIL